MGGEGTVKLEREVVQVLEDVLNLNGRGASFRADTPLLGAIPELDSMAVAGLIATLEERFGFTIDDDEIDGRIFATVGSLVGFVSGKMPA
jgi:acyl carrier protein